MPSLTPAQLASVRGRAKIRENIANLSFNDLIKGNKIPQGGGDDNDIQNIELKLEVLQNDKTRKTYLLIYDYDEGEQRYSLVSIYNIEGNNDNLLPENISLSMFISFSYIIGIYVDNYSEDDYEEKSKGNLYKIYLLSTTVNMTVNMKKEQEEIEGGQLKKGQKKKTLKKPVVSQNKENKYKEVLGKRMKIYKKPDSRKEFVRYKRELVPLVEYKKSMKEIAKNKNAKN
jgi:hypothetical protein